MFCLCFYVTRLFVFQLTKFCYPFSLGGFLLVDFESVVLVYGALEISDFFANEP